MSIVRLHSLSLNEQQIQFCSVVVLRIQPISEWIALVNAIKNEERKNLTFLIQ